MEIEKYIRKCLTSLLEQDYPTFEIVAVNDLSSDMTGRIMNEYGVKDSKRISVINMAALSGCITEGKQDHV